MVLISRELQSLLDSNSSTVNVNINTMYGNEGQLQSSVNNKNNLLHSYIKRRVVSIVFAVIALMLLVTTSLFTDLGLNIGGAILRFLGF